MTSLYSAENAISPVGKRLRRPAMVRPPADPLTNPIPALPRPPQQPFGPGNDLRSAQINPAASPRLTGAQGTTDQAASGVQNFNRGQAVSGYTSQFNQQLAPKPVGFRAVGSNAGMRSVNPNVQASPVNTQVAYNPAATNVQSRGVNTQVGFQGVNPNVQAGSVNTQASFRGVNPSVQARTADTQVQARSLYGEGMPSRTELAKRALADFAEQSALERTQGVQQIGRSAAALGRIGAGMTTNDLTGLEANIDRNRRVQETDLARSVAEGDISDRFRERDYLTGVDTQNVERGMADRDYLTGVDERNYGRATNERDTELGVEERNIGRGIDERDFLTGVGERNIGRQMSERDAAMGLSERNVGRDFADRDFTTGLDERNLARAADERGFATSLAERNTGRELDDRAFTTGLAERNVGRDYSMAQDETALDERNIARAMSERDAETGLEERNVGRDFDARRTALELGMSMGNAEAGDALDRFNTASQYERGIYGQDAADRDELRGERGFQEELARYALEQRIRQREMEEAERDAEFRRGAVRSGIQMQGSQQTQGQTEGAYDLLADWMRNRVGSGRAPSTTSIASRLPATPTYTPQAVPRPKIKVKGKGGRR